MLTFVVYGTLCYQQYQKLMAQPPTPFAVLADDTPPVATSEPAAAEAKDQ